MTIEHTINEKLAALSQKGIKRYLCDELEFDFGQLEGKRVLVFGCGNSIAKEFIRKQKLFEIEAIVDDYFSEESFNGIPVIGSNAIESVSSVYAVNLTFSFQAYNFFNRLALANRISMYNYYEVTQYFDFVSDYPYFNNILMDLDQHYEEYRSVLDRLEDDLSKAIVLKHLLYRLTFDFKLFLDVRERAEDQYFDLNMGEGEVFVDGGVFDAQTTLEFMKRADAIKKIYCFEPDAHNFALVEARLGMHSNVEILNAGLWNQRAKKYFMATSDEISRIVESGEIEIVLTTIDEAAGDASFIKLDIEGAEYEALEGAKETIVGNLPKLAVSIYHRPEDLYKILSLLVSYTDRYRYHIRHYGDYVFDTILYGVPK